MMLLQEKITVSAKLEISENFTMHSPPRFLTKLGPASVLLAVIAGFLPASPLHAAGDTNAVFVCFKGGTASSSSTPVQATVTNAGSGWNFSGAAQFPGTNWNQFLKPSTPIGDGTSNSTLGTTSYFQTVSNSILNNPSGTPTTITLSGTLTITRQDSTTNRTDPNSGNWATNNPLIPPGLDDNGWRIYRYENYSTWTFANLQTNSNYLLYVYGAYLNGAAYAGCYVRLTNANIPAGGASFLDVQGSTNGFVFQNSGGVISPVAPAVAGVPNSTNQSTWGVIPAVSDSNGKLVFLMTRPGVSSTYSTIATNSSINTTAAGTGGYWVNGFQLIPYPSPSITLQPASSPSATIGSAVSLSVTATNWYTNNNLTYQWYKGSAPLTDGATGTGSTNSGSTSPILNISNAQSTDAGNYTVVVSNPGGSVTSTVSALGVTAGAIAPTIASQPSSQTVAAGSPVTFTVSANGSAPLSYQWQASFDGGITWNNLGSNSATFSIPSPQISDSGLYEVLVSNSAGSLTSSAATLTVSQLAITTQPVTVVTATNSSQTLGVTITANPAPTYQWQTSVDGYSWTNVTGGTAATLSLNLSASNSGFYRVIASNTTGSVTSTVVMAGVLSTNLGAPSLLPSNNASTVNRDTPLEMTFSGPPTVGSAGKISIYDAASNTLVASYNLGTMSIAPGITTSNTYGIFHYASKVINGDTVNFTPVISLGTQPGMPHFPITPSGYGSNTAIITLPSTTYLNYGHTYYVTMDPGTFVDSQGAPFAGITNTNAWTFTVKSGGPSSGTTNLIVGNDGTSTDFSTVQGAADFIPTNNSSQTLVTLHQGFYPEIVHWKSPNVTLAGQGRTNTVVAFINNNNINPSTALRPVMDVVASNVTLQDLSVYNMTPYGGSQAESLYTYGSRITLNRVGLYSYQDTLLANSGTCFVTDSYIEGATDYIWGYAATMFQRCELKGNTNNFGYTQSRNSLGNSGFVFRNCTLDAYPGVTNGAAYLSRTFGDAAPASQTAYINCRMGSHINTSGWEIYTATTNTNATLQLWEYQSRDLSNTLLTSSILTNRPTFNRSFSVSGTNIVYTAGQTNSPDVLPNGQISTGMASLLTNFSVTLSNWTPPSATPDPSVTPVGGSNLYVYLNSTYVDSGATLADPVDGAINLTGSGSVNTALIGSYTVTYPGYTNSLNIPTPGSIRAVTVVSVPTPVLNGSGTMTCGWGVSFNDPGASVTDPNDGTVTLYGFENGTTLNATVLGNHTLTYAYTNSLGDVTASVQRTVIIDALPPTLPVFGTNSYNVTVPNPLINGGSIASTNNSTTDNASAINAYIRYCSTNGGGTVTIPAGNYNSGLITLRSNVDLYLASNAVLQAASYNSQLIAGSSITNFAITGSGALDGGATTTAGSVNLVILANVNTALLQGISIQNAGHEHVNLNGAFNMTVDGITINDGNTLAANGGNYLPNTDGIDYYGSNIFFKNCSVADGDDDIVAKPLYGAVANVTITNCTATAGHGFGIGGGLLYGAQYFLVTDSALYATAYGLRIKAQDNPTSDQGGLVSNVVYRNMLISNVSRPLVLESYYDGGDNYPSSPTDQSVYTTTFTTFTSGSNTYYNTYYSSFRRTNTPYTPTFKNISYINVTVTNAYYGGDFEGMYLTQPNINGLTFSNVSIQATNSTYGPMRLWHATNVTASNLRITVPSSSTYYNASPIKGAWTNDVGNLTVTTNSLETASITIGNTNQTYDGTIKLATATPYPISASPLSITYSNGSYPLSTNAPTNAGNYTVVATTLNPIYAGSSTATLTVEQASATLTLANTNQPYNGYPRSAGLAISPSNLPVTITYGDSTNAPVNVGSYPLAASVTDSNYSGSATATFVIYDAVGAWRQSFYGTSSNSGPAADTALSSSGLNNLQAYSFGINPTQAAFAPLLSLSNSASSITLNFLAKAAGSGAGYSGLSRYYNLEASTNLATPSWYVVPGYSNILGTNQSVILSTNTSGGPHWFYRLRAWLQ